MCACMYEYKSLLREGNAHEKKKEKETISTVSLISLICKIH